MNSLSPIVLRGGGLRLRQPTRPIPGRNRKIAGDYFFLLTRRFDLPVNDIGKRQHRQCYQSVDKKFTDGWNSGGAEKELQNFDQDIEEFVTQPVQKARPVRDRAKLRPRQNRVKPLPVPRSILRRTLKTIQIGNQGLDSRTGCTCGLGGFFLFEAVHIPLKALAGDFEILLAGVDVPTRRQLLQKRRHGPPGAIELLGVNQQLLQLCAIFRRREDAIDPRICAARQTGAKQAHNKKPGENVSAPGCHHVLRWGALKGWGIQRAHHQLQIERFLANSLVVINEGEGNRCQGTNQALRNERRDQRRHLPYRRNPLQRKDAVNPGGELDGPTQEQTYSDAQNDKQ